MTVKTSEIKKPIIEAKTFRIARLDEKNLILENWVYKTHPLTKESAPRWEIYGYYSQVKDMIQDLLKFQINIPTGTLDTQVAELLTEIKRVEKNLLQEINDAIKNNQDD